MLLTHIWWDDSKARNSNQVLYIRFGVVSFYSPFHCSLINGEKSQFHGPFSRSSENSRFAWNNHTAMSFFGKILSKSLLILTEIFRTFYLCIQSCESVFSSRVKFETVSRSEKFTVILCFQIWSVQTRIILEIALGFPESDEYSRGFAESTWMAGEFM